MEYIEEEEKLRKEQEAKKLYRNPIFILCAIGFLYIVFTRSRSAADIIGGLIGGAFIYFIVSKIRKPSDEIPNMHGAFLGNVPNFAKINEIDRALGQSNVDIRTEKDWPKDQWKFIQQVYNSHRPNGYIWIGGHFYWGGQGHILTVGSNGSGKGTCLRADTAPVFQVNSCL
jgi:hypothetical protein